MWIRPVSAVAGQLEKTHIQESIPTQALNTVPKQARGTIITKALGDLNRDGHVEQVVVVNIDGNREIHIYQYRHHQWQLWQSSAFHIMDSGDGGRDWFQDINIVRGALVILEFR
ncbi:hypothetical protein NFHSH190041_23070 [Shewanella sp. NFH-SH190041]|nr:hypothetical protein NFHSH190041_23070 [Shewanella sp. NFH-SH190041]